MLLLTDYLQREIVMVTDFTHPVGPTLMSRNVERFPLLLFIALLSQSSTIRRKFQKVINYVIYSIYLCSYKISLLIHMI
jgi:hypothetical protein